MPAYSADSEEKHRIISELGIKYFIDNYNKAIIKIIADLFRGYLRNQTDTKD